MSIDETIEGVSGRQENQRLKPLLILHFLKQNTDKDNLKTAVEIAEVIQEQGIMAERHSVGRDIKALNAAIIMVEEGCSLDEALEYAEDKREAPIVCINKKGYYYNHEKYFDLSNIKILADCIYASPFLAESKVDELLDIVCRFASKNEAQKIKNTNPLIGRVRTTNTAVLNSLSIINEAMSSKDWEGNEKQPEKISFKPVHYTINNVKEQVAKNADSKKTIVNPFGLFINNGNYYLLGYNDKNHNVYPYRIDRMKDVRIVHEPREGKEAITKRGGIKAFAEKRFSLQTSKSAKVEIEFDNYCLDMVIDRLGTKGVHYYLGNDRDKTFAVTIADVELTNDFFAWVMSFGKSAKILTPEISEKYIQMLEGIKEIYQS